MCAGVCVCVQRLNILQENKAAHEFSIIYQAKGDATSCCCAPLASVSALALELHLVSLQLQLKLEWGVYVCLGGESRVAEIDVEVGVEFWHCKLQVATANAASLVWFYFALCALLPSLLSVCLLHLCGLLYSTLAHRLSGLQLQLQLRRWLGNYN